MTEVDENQPHAQPFAQPWNLRYGLLLISVLAQFVSFLITWPLWNARSEVPHLPVLEFGIPQLPFGWLLVLTLAVIPFRPKVGVWLHFGVMLVACLFDQMRAQPQFLATWLLMFATLKQANQNYIRWFLSSLWIWAGVHKAISPEWNSYRGWAMTSELGLDPEVWAATVCVVVAASEILGGLLAWFKPKWGAVACVMLHCGIAIYLSPLFRDWNYSVLPWNLATAIVGAWILWTCDSQSKVVHRVLFGLFLAVPAGFYVGWVDHGYAHVLYSGSMPQALITRADGSVETIQGWGDLAVPFPKERRTLKQRFECVAEVGDRLHILDPRPALDDLYFVKLESGLSQIERCVFLELSEMSIAGVELDSKRHVFYLTRAGIKMLKRNEGEMIYAIEFEPEKFSAELLKHLRFLPNLEQVQLSGTSVSDSDLESLLALPKLVAVGLNETAISDQGLDVLSKLESLKVIQADGSKVTPEKLLDFNSSRFP
jgi:hypothetical protein